jgi:hypothetical protein
MVTPAAMGMSPLRLFLRACGRPVVATVNEVIVHHHRSNGDDRPAEFIAYQYSLDGQIHSDLQQLISTQFDTIQKGSQISGTAFRLGSWTCSITSAADMHPLGLPAAIIIEALLALWAGSVLKKLGNERRLIREGTATIGTVVSRRADRIRPGSNDARRRFITFRFKTADGTEMTTEIQTYSTHDYSAAEVGSDRMILYDPMKPRRNLVYEYSQYEVVPLVG